MPYGGVRFNNVKCNNVSAFGHIDAINGVFVQWASWPEELIGCNLSVCVCMGVYIYIYIYTIVTVNMGWNTGFSIVTNLNNCCFLLSQYYLKTPIGNFLFDQKLCLLKIFKFLIWLRFSRYGIFAILKYVKIPKTFKNV